ncbi:MAG: nucleoside phosphorylase [Bacteroidales bacterium]|nr:nucleoside phosphorylase [Bacteroidales bacterium]
MKQFPPSELLVNADGSIFHLHLKPGQLANNVLLVGDPGRVEMIAGLMDSIEHRAANREFVTVTGTYKGKRVSVVGTGIGTDNIDIVVNELDALVNIDLDTRFEKPNKTVLNLVRIGTCGGLQPDLPPGTFLISAKSVSLDGLLLFYDGSEAIRDLPLEKAFCQQTQWPVAFNHPCVVTADPELVARIGGTDMKQGVTITANGFYGPQGRELRIPLAKPDLNEQLTAFSFEGQRITNYEMESSAVAGLGALLGHKAMTVCLVIANRLSTQVNVDYKSAMKALVTTVLDRL